MSSRVYSGDQPSIAEISEELKSGNVIALPTETVYGLAANALNEDAVLKIFEIKGRPLVDPLICHVQGAELVSEVAVLQDGFEELSKAFWPGPLTIVLPKKAIVPDRVTAGLGSIAIRCPAHPLMQAILKESGLTLAAPSANPFGYISPTTAQHVIDSLGDRITGVLDGGPCQHGLESTIIQLNDSEPPTLLRPGPISLEALEQCLKTKVQIKSKTADESKAQIAPGMLTRHYSPHTPIMLVDRIEDSINDDKTAYVYLKRPVFSSDSMNSSQAFWFSEDGELASIGAEMFSLLRKLDQQEWNQIVIERPPASGIGAALNDRLNRAAAQLD